MESTRLKKIERLIQKELGDYFQKQMRSVYNGNMVSVTQIRVSADLSYAKVYVSIFPTEKSDETFEVIEENAKAIRGELAQRLRYQLRKTPELQFFIDDSLDYADRIDELLNK